MRIYWLIDPGCPDTSDQKIMSLVMISGSGGSVLVDQVSGQLPRLVITETLAVATVLVIRTLTLIDEIHLS